jgi:hypothetical protein
MINMRFQNIILAIPLCLASAPIPAASWEVDFLGPAREISHSSSASRDTAALGLVAAPHRILTGGGDFSVLQLRDQRLSLRLGVFAMMELESEGKSSGFDGMPMADSNFWRGLWGYSVAASLDDFASRHFGPRGALEFTLNIRHESEHYSGSNDGGDGIDYSDRPQIGNFVMLDVAARVPLGRLDLIGRLQHKFFVTNAGGYSQGPGGDLIVRWRRWNHIHPFSSLFAEYLFGRKIYPDAYLVRNLTGFVVPSRAGDIYLFISADVGNRKGLAVFTEERTLGFGVRFAFF